MTNFPGTAMPLLSPLEHPTLAQRLKAQHPLVPPGQPYADPAGAHVDEALAAAHAPLDVEAIRATINQALAPVPLGTHLAPDTLAGIAQRLNWHMTFLLPIAEARGLDRATRAYLRRRVEHGPPSAHDYPVCTQTWLQDNARSCQMLLGLAIADEAAEHQHAGVVR
ncbi:hypothetical protein ACFY1P_29730 [Streptomyces sp. NPDC001407]|uniref:hypothetical protein n=1 Tax=unclassified Streptomyces TaxID=2593676 RepID=UPI003692C9C3